MTCHIGQYAFVMTAVGYKGQYGPQHDRTLRKWHSLHDIQIIVYRGWYKPGEWGQIKNREALKEFLG